MSEVVKVECKGEHIVIVEDFNNHVGDAIVDNHNKVTFGGRLVRKLIESGKYILVNNSEKTTGSPFTRYDPTDPLADEKKAALTCLSYPKICYNMLIGWRLIKIYFRHPADQSKIINLNLLTITR